MLTTLIVAAGALAAGSGLLTLLDGRRRPQAER